MDNIISEKQTILLIPILEKKREMREIFAIFEGGEVEERKQELFVCKCGEIYKEWEKGKRRVCPSCNTPFYPSYYFRKIRKPVTEHEKTIRDTKENFKKIEEKSKKFKVDWNKFYSWSSNNKKNFEEFEKNGILKKTKKGKSYIYNLDFELLSELYLDYLQVFTPLFERKSVDLKLFKKQLSSFLTQNRHIFSYEVWKFIFGKNSKGEFPFNSIFGFMNFVFLSIPVTKLVEEYDTKTNMTDDELGEFSNILSVWQIISDTAEEMYAKTPIWELESGIEKDGKIIGVMEGYHLVTEETNNISNIEVPEDFIRFLKKLYSYTFTEVEEKTDSGLDYFFKKGFKVKLNNEFLPIKEYCKITFDRKIRKMLVS